MENDLELHSTGSLDAGSWRSEVVSAAKNRLGLAATASQAEVSQALIRRISETDLTPSKADWAAFLVAAGHTSESLLRDEAAAAQFAAASRLFMELQGADDPSRRQLLEAAEDQIEFAPAAELLRIASSAVASEMKGESTAVASPSTDGITRSLLDCHPLKQAAHARKTWRPASASDLFRPPPRFVDPVKRIDAPSTEEDDAERAQNDAASEGLLQQRQSASLMLWGALFLFVLALGSVGRGPPGAMPPKQRSTKPSVGPSRSTDVLPTGAQPSPNRNAGVR